jgi:hypothetical protein
VVGPRPVVARRGPGAPRLLRTAIVVLAILVSAPSVGTAHGTLTASASAQPSDPVGNFSAAINRMVELVAIAGSGILALVWVRVALSWFSNDITKKVQAKDRARDALVGTLLFTAAITGLVWGLAHWVLTGS